MDYRGLAVPDEDASANAETPTHQFDLFTHAVILHAVISHAFYCGFVAEVGLDKLVPSLPEHDFAVLLNYLQNYFKPWKCACSLLACQ